MGLTIGEMLQNRYRTVSRLGQGGMGAVYRAWDTRLNVPVALKEMTPQPGLDPHTLTQLRRQFQQEATVLARLDHPNLVRVTDFFEETGNLYLAMDFVAGESLADHIKRDAPLPEAQVLEWARQLLHTLEYCHSQNVIHRDIKPQNIIIHPDGHVELVDFGLVKLWDPSAPRTQTAMKGMGTPEYAPPEQYGIQPGHTDPRSDIYGVGATLYHALTAQAPSTAGDRMASPNLFIPLRQLNPRVSTATEAAILKAMELPLASRFQSAQEMAAALSGAPPAQAQPRPTQVLPSTQPTTPLLQRVPRWALVAGGPAGLALIVIVGLALGNVGGRTLGLLPAQTTPAPAVYPTLPLSTVTPYTAPATPPPLPALAGTPAPRPATAITPENADQVTQLARWGKGSVEQIAYSPDGRLLAVASSLGAHLYDARTLEEIWFLQTDVRVMSMAFSPDGEMLALGSQDKVIQLWDISKGTLLHVLTGHTSYVTSVAFSPAGDLLASGSWDNTVRLWRVSDGTLLGTLEGHADIVTSVDFSPDGALVASGANDDTVRLWKVNEKTLLQTLTRHTDDVSSVAFSPDGALLASGSRDETVQLWRTDNWRPLRALDPPSGWTNWITSLSFSPDGQTLVAGTWGEVQLWQVASGAPLRTLKGHTSRVVSVAFSPDEATLASGSDDNTVRVWQVESGTLLRTLEGYTAGIKDMALSPNGEIIASTADYDALRLWRVENGSQLQPLEEDPGDVQDLAFSPDSRLLALASDHQIRIWQVDSASLRAMKEETAWVRSVAFSPNGELLASGWDDGAIQLWRFADGTLLPPLEGHTDDVGAIAFSPDGALLASGSNDETVRLWQVSDGTPLHTLARHTSWVTSVAFSPDGTLLASGSWDGTVRLWQVADGALLRTMKGDTNDVESVVFSPDGTTLAVGADDTAQLWRVSDGALVRILEGHVGEVKSVAFSSDGTILASGSDDGTVRLWGVVEE